MIQLGALADYLRELGGDDKCISRINHRTTYRLRLQSEFDLTVARANDTNKLYWTYTYHNGVTEVWLSPTV